VVVADVDERALAAVVVLCNTAGEESLEPLRRRAERLEQAVRETKA